MLSSLQLFAYGAKVVFRIKKEDKSDSKNALIAEKISDGKAPVMVNDDTQCAFPFDEKIKEIEEKLIKHKIESLKHKIESLKHKIESLNFWLNRYGK
uniref:Uncharacterized protein n=1 Tax=Panagrolaimus davidi TaxID=227884 RepID=A0A914QR42_9BILA